MHPLLTIPQRRSLVGQCAHTIRQGIENNIWGNYLPGERILCEKLRVSRPTLRKALGILEEEKLIQVSHGKRRKILHPKRTAPPPNQTSQVGVIIGALNSPINPNEMFLINQIKDPLHEAGLGMEIFTQSSLFSSRPEHALEGLTANSSIVAWMLVATPKSVQSWFARHTVPSVVVGSCDSDIHLPSIDLDYRAVCRHAAGFLLAKGHRHIGLIVPASNLAGDVASETGFQEGIRASKQENIRGTLIRHDGTIDGLCKRLQFTLDMTSPPTALLVAKPLHLLTTLSYLYSCGYHVPNDISLISRDYEPYLNQIVPSLACYRFRRRRLTSQLAQMVIQLATAGGLPKVQRKLTPDFDSGNSVQQLESSDAPVFPA